MPRRISCQQTKLTHSRNLPKGEDSSSGPIIVSGNSPAIIAQHILIKIVNNSIVTTQSICREGPSLECFAQCELLNILC